ncbi:MAG TPA: non-homologous end-joining DNA ligase [Gemmatimonadaceae bacterium]|nr:non-homologous end-joining DNA ligase [Gemmatimonadaceae bacterium]
MATAKGTRAGRKTGRASTKLRTYRAKRHFDATPEPSGNGAGTRSPRTRHALQFVIQKHAASHLHFDLRLEMDGVMKSWAVPKGPSLDPSVKRLAMQVEDHPIEYNTFEGTIPKGEYGGGTVMVWDRGTYTSDPPSPNAEDALRRAYATGDLKFTLDGARLHGSWVLVRTKRGAPDKPQWLLIKHRDEAAEPGTDIVADVETSAATGRTMDEIANGSAPKRRGRSKKADPAAARSPSRARRVALPALPALQPMLARVGAEVPQDDGWTFEPKYDGIRVLAYATAGEVRLMTRNDLDKSKQFPEIVDAIERLVARVQHPLVLDGEIVALARGKPGRFQGLQSRLHVQGSADIERLEHDAPAALMVFDLLLDGDDILLDEPWSERRKRLELRLRNRTDTHLRLGDSAPGGAREMLRKARASGWEGIMAKRTDSAYAAGQRPSSWLKLKLERRQEFVVGGYTEPRNSRQHFGSLLVGYYEGDRLVYAGHVGGGFDQQSLRDTYAQLARLARKTSPFDNPPKPNEPAHWVRPTLVVEVKFNEWTDDGLLRQPVFLGTRDDKDARAVTREPVPSASPSAARP